MECTNRMKERIKTTETWKDLTDRKNGQMDQTNGKIGQMEKSDKWKNLINGKI